MRLLVFQHIDCEHPGQLRHHLEADGIDWTVVELDEGKEIPPLEPFDALWVMGGPMDVWDTDTAPWLIHEKQAIRRWVAELRRPYLGLCLGHQLLADSLGGTCAVQQPPEIGVMPIELTPAGRTDPIFAGMSHRQMALQWHSVAVVDPPQGARILADSPQCANQAMGIGDYAYSMQYHVEVEAETVGAWGAIPAYRQALEATLGPSALPSMMADAQAQMDGFNASAAQLYKNFRAVVQRWQADLNNGGLS